ncbi:hypothetical protein [Candidatus Fokinia solitaria]|nr:hypothetical protein [Candidatus Fokinia solitaria]
MQKVSFEDFIVFYKATIDANYSSDYGVIEKIKNYFYLYSE